MLRDWVPVIALGLATAIQVVMGVDRWRHRRERQEVKAEASDDRLTDRMRRAETRLRDIEREVREVVTKEDFRRLEGRVDDVWLALRRNGHTT